MSVPGLLRQATVNKYRNEDRVLEVILDNSNTTVGRQDKIIQIPASFYSSNGLFIGGIPEPGTKVIVGQAEGGKWVFVAYVPTIFSSSRLTGANLTAPMPVLKSGELLIQSNDSTKIGLNNENHIYIGSSIDKIDINTNTGVYLDTFDTKLSFTEAGRHVFGALKRDLSPNKFQSSNSKLNSPLFDNFLVPISLDPRATPKNNTRIDKNPIFVENRELMYEFMYSSKVTDEVKESSLYTKAEQKDPIFIYENRRKSRADTLSLSLLEPNYLMETVKGTVVDIFGNILDINRTKILTDDTITLKPEGSLEKDKVYLQLRELQRKSIAYHFEINARKDFKGKNGTISLPDITSNEDYARNRSRFFLDIDKEGLIKLNVPASSESGNVPLLVRYENYSSFSEDDSKNPNQLFKREDGLDIALDSFARTTDPQFPGGVIRIVNDKDEIVTVKDRITQQHLLHGSAYHNIFLTCIAHQSDQHIKDIVIEPTFNISNIPTYNEANKAAGRAGGPIVSSKIIVEGSNANAGGRSGSLNFDGSIELNVGANTVDRQSIWLDTAGGIVGNIGRDRNNLSAAISMDGDLLLQVGGYGVVSDSRFEKSNNAIRPGAIDIRVFNDGFECTLVRIDKEGVKIITPGNMVFQSQGDMVFRAGANMKFDAERIVVHEVREILKSLNTSI